MEISPEILQLFEVAPWAFVAALLAWPDKGVIALLIHRNQAIKLSELERGLTHKELAAKAKRKGQPKLPAPVGSKPAESETENDPD